MDAEIRELRRRVDEAPSDESALHALATALFRAGRGTELPLVLLPWRSAHALVAVVEKTVVPVVALPFAATTRAILVEDRLAGITERAVSVRDACSLAELPGSPFPLPEGYEARALALSEDVLYVGGRGTSNEPELLLVRDLANPERPWHRGSSPPVATRSGQAIAVLRVTDTQLEALQSGSPSLWLFFGRRLPSYTPHLAFNTIRWHERSEELLTASFGPRWGAALSRAEGVSFIALFDERQRIERYVFESKEVVWHDLLVQRDRLHVAAGEKGVAVCDLDLPEPVRLRPPYLEGRSTATRLPLENFRYRDPGLAAGEKVVRIAEVPGTWDQFVVAIAASDGRVERFAVVR